MKLRRLLLGSSLIMFIGFIAVFAAIFYKINSSNDDRVVEFPTEIDLGRGGQVIQFGADSGVLFFVVTGPLGGEVLARVDAETGVILSRTSLGQ
ncbi:hypothetical protein JM93_03550 [Roseibium hamelinense]|uniref:Uncharacterized protein n=2 Tax=Roseibium hamelinense TaxID=150831 RepID=A0A562SLN1_9HYPH|nr:hypothetical protein JM93_03550 [Roseibium hamelinense]